MASNLLELFNAAANFYLYCMCNREIRGQVWKMLTSIKGKLPGRKKAFDTNNSSQMEVTQLKNMSELFPEIFEFRNKRK